MSLPFSPKSALAVLAASTGVIFSIATSEAPRAGLSATLPDGHEEVLAGGESVSFPLHITLRATEVVSFSDVAVVAALDTQPIEDRFGAAPAPEDGGVADVDGGPAGDVDAGAAAEADPEVEAPADGPRFRVTIAQAVLQDPVVDQIVDAETFGDLAIAALEACAAVAPCDATDDFVLTLTRVDDGEGTASIFWRARASSTYSGAMAAPAGDAITISIAPPDELPADDDAGTPGDDDAGAASDEDAGAASDADAGA